VALLDARSILKDMQVGVGGVGGWGGGGGEGGMCCKPIQDLISAAPAGGWVGGWVCLWGMVWGGGGRRGGGDVLQTKLKPGSSSTSSSRHSILKDMQMRTEMRDMHCIAVGV
jgi:hypothetical protein